MANAAAIDVEKINVAEILDREESKAQSEHLLAAFEANPAAMKVLEAVETVEDAYQIVKHAAKVTLEQFKVIFDKTVNYFKDDKVALEDETLDYVAGGSGWFSQVWNKWKKQIVMGATIVACTVAGIAIGAAVGGLEGALMGGCAGAIIGTAVGAGAAQLV